MAASSDTDNSSMEQQCQQLAQRLWSQLATLQADRRLVVALSGIPGAGKSTVSDLVVQSINALHHDLAAGGCDADQALPVLAVAVPMDGFHLTRAQLKQMPDPETATHRRGAAFTYDAEAYLAFVQRLREPVTPCVKVSAPSFDHAIKDPVVDDIAIPATARIVLIEGNYCALTREPWATAARLMDELWYVEVDRELACKRLALRHVRSGLAPDVKAALERVHSTDILNADDVVHNMLPVQEIIRMT